MARRVTRGNVREIVLEDIKKEEEARRSHESTPEYRAAVIEVNRQSSLPSEHPDHICGLHCDGQDGQNSMCWRIRDRLGYYQGEFISKRDARLKKRRRKLEAEFRDEQD